MFRSLPTLALLLALTVPLPGAEKGFTLEHGGMFIRDSTLPGERRKDDVHPRCAVCVQLARMRWLIVYTTRGYRGVDDERSVLYQVRRDGPDGPVVKEGFLAQAGANWRREGVPPAPEGRT